MLLVGPTGVGKTKAAKAVQHVSGGRSLISFNMAEYNKESDINHFTGAPPAYAGDPQGRLAKHLVEFPNSVVLLDEISRAHPAVQLFFLSAFDQGVFHTQKNGAMDCSSAVFVMTNNVGADLLVQHARQLRHAVDKSKQHDDAIRKLNAQLFKWPAEFHGRIQLIALFPPFVMPEDDGMLRQIAGDILKVSSCIVNYKACHASKTMA